MSHHGTATVTDFLKDFSHDEVAFLILDRNQGEIRSMDHTELNHVLIDMVPHMSNLTTGAAIAPSSKKVLLRDIVKKWEAAKHTTTDPLDHKTMSFDNRFPDVIQVLKDEVHAIAESENPERRKLITTDGKCAIPDIAAYALEEFLLRGHGSDSAPSSGKSE
jgi:hypothetical protein